MEGFTEEEVGFSESDMGEGFSEEEVGFSEADLGEPSQLDTLKQAQASKPFSQQLAEYNPTPVPETAGEQLLRSTKNVGVGDKAFGAGIARGAVLPEALGVAGNVISEDIKSLAMTGKPLTAAQRQQAGESVPEAMTLAQEAAPIQGTLGEIGGSLLPIPGPEGIASVTGMGTALLGRGVKAASKAAKAGAEDAALKQIRPTGKQYEKIRKVRPDLGRKMLDEGIIGPAASKEGIRERVVGKISEIGDELDAVYKQADEKTGGKTVNVEDMKAALTKKRNAYAEIHTDEDKVALLDKEIAALDQYKNKYGDDKIPASIVRRIKAAHQEKAYGKTQLPVDPGVYKDLAKIYQEQMVKDVSGLADDTEKFSTLNTRLGDMLSVNGILSGKAPSTISPAELGIGLVGTAVHPGAIATTVAAPIVRERGYSAAARGLDFVSKALEKGAPPEKVQKIVDKYGDTVMARILINRLAEKGDEE